ncbi:MAG TPA: flagellar basal body rod protein FlgB [Leptolinea sp.]
MAGSIISDSSFQATKIALEGLAARQQVISRNIANADTPGYQSETVNFETAIKQALNKTQQLPMQTTNAAHILPTGQSGTIQVANRTGGTERADQNNVDIDTELSDMTDTAMRYQTLTTEASKKILLLKAIAAAR